MIHDIDFNYAKSPTYTNTSEVMDIPVSELVAMQKDIYDFEFNNIEELSQVFDALSSGVDSITSTRLDNDLQKKDLQRLKESFLLSEDNVTKKLNSESVNKGVVLQMAKSMDRLTKTDTYKRIIQAQAESDDFLKKIPTLRAKSPILADLAKASYITEYINKKDRKAGEPDFNVSIEEFVPMDVRKYTKELLELEIPKKIGITTRIDDTGTMIIVDQNRNIELSPGSKGYEEKLLEYRSKARAAIKSEMNRLPIYKNNMRAFVGVNSNGIISGPEYQLKQQEVINSMVDGFIKDNVLSSKTIKKPVYKPNNPKPVKKSLYSMLVDQYKDQYDFKEWSIQIKDYEDSSKEKIIEFDEKSGDLVFKYGDQRFKIPSKNREILGPKLEDRKVINKENGVEEKEDGIGPSYNNIPKI